LWRWATDRREDSSVQFKKDFFSYFGKTSRRASVLNIGLPPLLLRLFAATYSGSS
jgi:hypothetical protein